MLTDEMPNFRFEELEKFYSKMFRRFNYEEIYEVTIDDITISEIMFDEEIELYFETDGVWRYTTV